MGPFRLVAPHASFQKEDLAFWLAKTAQERVEAVEFLRRQCLYATGHSQEPRMTKVLTLVPCRA
jgi:hypothetical protein